MPNERVLWIADKTGFEKSVKRGLTFLQFVYGLRDYIYKRLQREGVAASELPPFELFHPSHVIDTIYFGDSHESLGLQFADVCCATIAQHLLCKDDAEPFYNLIRPQVVTENTLVKYSDAWKENTPKPKP